MDDPLDAFDDPVDPQTTQMVGFLEDLVAELPKPYSMTAAEYRAFMATHPVLSQRPVAENASDRTIPGPVGDIPIRVYLPERIDGVYLHFHGGGWTLGSPDQHDGILGPRAEEANVAIVSVDYRLAPEHPYPAGPDDCEAAARWLVAHSAEEFGTDTIVLGGDSAGAHLAAVTLLRLRDRDGFTGFSGVELRYGMYDLRELPGVRADQAPLLDRRSLHYYLDNFVPAERRDDPDVSPLLASLHDLPPALFVCGTADLVVEDSIFMWTRWRAAGNEATLRLYPGAPHAFDSLPIPVGREATDEVTRFVEQCVAGVAT